MTHALITGLVGALVWLRDCQPKERGMAEENATDQIEAGRKWLKQNPPSPNPRGPS